LEGVGEAGRARARHLHQLILVRASEVCDEEAGGGGVDGSSRTGLARPLSQQNAGDKEE
jgi:hypothetical protein